MGGNEGRKVIYKKRKLITIVIFWDPPGPAPTWPSCSTPPGSTDRAVLYDSPNDDILRVTPSYSNLYNKSEFFNRAVYFDEVVVQASERTWRDRVYFFDSPGHDHLHAVGDLAEFDYTALGRVLQAYGFTWVRAPSSQGDAPKHDEA